jgi:chromosome segregation ATPase
MAAEINELFEEGITRSRELTEAADQAMNAIDEMAGHAEELARRVEDEGQQACQHLRELAGRLEDAEGRLERARSQADGALEALAGKAAEVKSEAGELLERVRKAAAEIEARADELDGALDSQMASTQQGFQELERGTQRAQAQAEEDLQQAAQRIAALRTAIEAARREFDQKQRAWNDALGGLETTVQDKAEECVGAVNELMRRQSQALVGAANAMVDRHNAAMDALKQRFVEQAPQDLAMALDPLEAALTTAGEAAAEHERRLSAEAEQLEQWVGATVPTVTSVRAALDAAAGRG